MDDVPVNAERLGALIFDAIASKRILKTGYVRQPGGLYPLQCDTVAAHSHTVSFLAVVLAAEHREPLAKGLRVALSLEDVALMAIMHDHGETRSGDTGATSQAIYGVCKLYRLEKEGLAASVTGLRIAERVMRLFDDYRQYATPESLVVHIADNLEGFEKALHSAAGLNQSVSSALDILAENLDRYRRQQENGGAVGAAAGYLIDHVLIPGTRAVADAYELGASLHTPPFSRVFNSSTVCDQSK